MKRLIPLFKAHALAFIILIATTIIVYSCKKDLGIDAKKIDQKDLKEIQAWYNQNKATTRVAFNNLQPLWNAVYLNKQPNDLDVYEIKLSNPKKVYLRLSESAGDAHKKNNIRLLIFKDKANGQIIAGCYMSIVDEGPELQDPNKIHYKDVKRLNGTVMFFGMGGKPQNGWEYIAGKIIKRINATIKGYYGTNGTTLSDLKNPTLSENSGRNRLMVAMPPSCPLPSPVYREVCVGVDGYMECTYVFIGFVCEDGVPINPEDGNYYPTYAGNNGNGGGNGTTRPTKQQLEDAIKNKPFALLKDVPCETLKAWLATAKFTPNASIIDKLNTLKNSGLDAFLFGEKIARIQSIDDASSPVVNMDYFPININQMPIVNGQRLSPDQFIHYLRTNLDSFTDGAKIFTPYNNYGIDDTAKWNSNDPTGSILALDIKGPDNASVITSKSTSNGWTFTTIYEPMYGEHPVSGNRDFGYHIDSNGSFTFYTRGVDRLTSVDGDFANTIPQFLGFAKGIPFWQADGLWTSFQNKIKEFVISHQGSATIKPQEILRPQWDSVLDVLEGRKPLSTLSNNCPD